MTLDEYKLLRKINSPRDLKQLSAEELRTYCDELRSYIIDECSVNPGHLASSLGCVELAAALHYVFDTPADKIVWDVGHQTYAHKIITGRREAFKTKRLLAAQGFYEASTLAFYSNTELDMLHIPAEDEARKAIRILNPISENLSIMRTLLTPSMLNVIVDNLKKGNAEGRLFEMAPVYLAKELPINEHPHERQTLCIGAFGPEEDFFTVKGALEALAAGFGLTFDYQRETAAWLHPGISAAVYCNGKRLGVFGKLANEINAELEIAKEQKDSQNIYLGELDYEALMSCVEGELRYKPLSPYAPVKRDLALVCGEAVSCGEIEETIRKASPLVSEVKLFDIYRGANLGEGKKSMAFSLSLSDPKKEVSAEEVERVVKKILGNLKFKLGIEIR